MLFSPNLSCCVQIPGDFPYFFFIIASTFSIKKTLKALYLKLRSVTTVKEDFKIGLENVYEDLFKVFNSSESKTPTLPDSAEDLVETFRVRLRARLLTDLLPCP